MCSNYILWYTVNSVKVDASNGRQCSKEPLNQNLARWAHTGNMLGHCKGLYNFFHFPFHCPFPFFFMPSYLFLYSSAIFLLSIPFCTTFSIFFFYHLYPFFDLLHLFHQYKYLSVRKPIVEAGHVDEILCYWNTLLTMSFLTDSLMLDTPICIPHMICTYAVDCMYYCLIQIIVKFLCHCMINCVWCCLGIANSSISISFYDSCCSGGLLQSYFTQTSTPSIPFNAFSFIKSCVCLP